MELVLKAMQDIEETYRLKQLLGFPKDVLQTWCDPYGMDILHHAILANNIEGVSILFSCGFFKPPHETSGYPYMHLASALGHTTILLMLFQERPQDNRTQSFEWSNNNNSQIKNAIDDHSTRDGEYKTPLDIAAESENIRCVHAILDHSENMGNAPQKVSKTNSYVYLACMCNSPSALYLLLKKESTDEEIKEAVGLSLKLALPECLDCLLKYKTDVSSLFGEMNLYHVLYSYSLSFNKKWYESLLAVTIVLLKHGHSVISLIPFRTYPLYSLLSHSFCHDFENSAPYLIACLLVLLNAGANPNFNEITFEKNHESESIQTAFGRNGFSSALYCLFHAVHGYLLEVENKLLVSKYFLKTTEILLRHGGDATHVGVVGDNGQVGNLLHYLFVIAFGVSAEVIPLQPVMKLLLRHGADPDCMVNNFYPMNTLLENILKYHSTFHLREGEFLIRELSQHMTFTHLTKATITAQNQTVSFSVGEKQNTLVTSILSYLHKNVTSIWSLKKFCTINIVLHCGRNLSNILKLPLPMSIKTKMTNIFTDEQCDYEDVNQIDMPLI